MLYLLKFSHTSWTFFKLSFLTLCFKVWEISTDISPSLLILALALHHLLMSIKDILYFPYSVFFFLISSVSFWYFLELPFLFLHFLECSLLFLHVDHFFLISTLSVVIIVILNSQPDSSKISTLYGYVSVAFLPLQHFSVLVTFVEGWKNVRDKRNWGS